MCHHVPLTLSGNKMLIRNKIPIIYLMGCGIIIKTICTSLPLKLIFGKSPFKYDFTKSVLILLCFKVSTYQGFNLSP